MEPRSARRLRRSPPSPPHGAPSSRVGPGGGADLISALPDEMLLLVLARLCCVRAAAKTSLLSRRWRGVWTGLTDLTFRCSKPATIESALAARFAASTPVSVLRIDLQTTVPTVHDANSLLRAAARLSPTELVFTLPPLWHGSSDLADMIELPCFNRATSIELDMMHFHVRVGFAGDFTLLERLSISGNVVELSTLHHNRCPRLRVLSVTSANTTITLPPDNAYPALDSLLLTGETIVGLGSFLNRCPTLRKLSLTHLDSQKLTLPPTAKSLLTLEELSLARNIVDLGTMLSRCPRLRVLSATFRGVDPSSIEAALLSLEGAVALGLVLSLLDIHVPDRSIQDNVDADRLVRFTSFLGTVGTLSPQKLVFTHDKEYYRSITSDLPCSHRATSIVMNLHNNICFTVPPTSTEFSSLHTLSLSGKCKVLDIGTLVARCPRLRVLKAATVEGNIIVHSALLQELDIVRDIDTGCRAIDIVTPVLNQLRLEVRAGRDIGVSIAAPAVEKLTWNRWYTGLPLVFGCWWIETMRVHTVQNISVDNMDDSCCQVQLLPVFHVLSLQLYPCNYSDGQLNLEQEMEKLPLTNFSVLELDFKQDSHVYGALVLHLLRMRRIRATTKKLNVVLPCTRREGGRQACLGNCFCDAPPNNNRSSQSAFCTHLEEVEIDNFGGEDHEHDFLTLIFKCSPMLKRMTVRLARTFRGSTRKLHNIFLAHPCVNCTSDFNYIW